MGKINVLSFAVANLIAAGEVVDRPSSVIKELLENAIDSGADRITVEIQNGGVTYMRVSDNGCGIEPEDLPVAIRRHATSKIKDASDLESILTLGFRGEALAAIASVSDLRIISKTPNAQIGAMLEASGGEIRGVSERACSDGTTVIVENLFANVPARRKFLKKDVTESMAVSALVEKIALSKPHIAFRLITDGNIRLETVGDGNLKNAVYSVFGREFASKLIPAQLSVDGIEVTGFVGRSDNVRANRNYQNFFINGRYVKSKTACAALEQAYTSYIPPEKFPCCVLFLKLNPAAVDVNVHPAKLEVKFSNEKPIFEAIYYAVRNALESNVSRPDVTLKALEKTGSGSKARLSDSQTPIEEGRPESLKKRQIASELYTPVTIREQKHVSSAAVSASAEPSKRSSEGFLRLSAEEYVERYRSEEKKSTVKTTDVQEAEQKTVVTQSPAPQPKTISSDTRPEAPQWIRDLVGQGEPKETEPKSNEPLPVSEKLTYRIIGEAFHAYVLVELEDKLLVIDKHAAHERILFEKLKAGMHGGGNGSQMLMLPIEVMMTSDEIQTLDAFREEIEAVGFSFALGRHTASVTAIPEGIDTDAVPDMLAVIAERIKSNTGSAKLTRDIIFEKALYQASCKAAVKAGREYPEGHVKWIVDQLMAIPDITVCPHGRPVAMELRKKNLDHQFERS